MTTPQLSIIVPTYNRAESLGPALESALQQTADPASYEIVVVNNNSTDRTGEVIDDLERVYGPRLRQIVEHRQGVSYAREAGINEVRAPIVALFDDDVRVMPNWVETILRTFAEYPEFECIGGKVLPAWSSPPPRWLTRDHWAPLALQDFGDQRVIVSQQNPRVLITANLAIKKCVFDRIGMFSPQFQRVKDDIGSLEDDEWMRRFWKAGGRGLYVPELVAVTDVPSIRTTRTYHRRWHSGHGRFYALLRAEEMERTSKGSLFGVPGHLYRSALRDAVRWLSSTLTGHSGRAFDHEVKLRFFRGFVGQRFMERRYP
jgi:glucosyl-dolichyl phosphate glucuronosyltransferase